MIKMYPLEWFDSLIVNTFSPYTDSISSISEYDSKVLCENIIGESQKIKVQIKVEVFELKSKRQIRLLVRKYHSSFVFLLDSIMESRKNERFISSGFVKIFDLIVTALDDLLSFVEIRFSNFISLDQRAPITYLIVWRTELQTSLEMLLKKKGLDEEQNKEFKMIINLLLSQLYGNKKVKFTYRQVLYLRELVKELEEFSDPGAEIECFSSLDILLIRLNFNSTEYADYLITKVANYLSSFEILSERFENVLYCYTKLVQVNSNLKITFNPSQQNLITFLEYWFANEIKYLEKKINFLIQEQNSLVNGNSIWQSQDNGKLECILSADQIGLILRATDETRIIKAKSMSYFFKSIVPYLSTPFKKDLSYQSVRSKSYNAEERDKEIAIQSLEKIIRKIKTY
ncbi:hypothetical protein [Flavobacterium johnsoniae]|uniref:Uncharacterized protein n=1 Tax=Flavobacterium johnsoniae TaxID=986 RepID=A0A1M5W3E2_FLAJO|nr:hypothetical protein [Flavobacterium johnsoniae]SHH82099.1 hypothetical protein SAMN05444388_1238 [Flavobacterium johnsoniae]